MGVKTRHPLAFARKEYYFPGINDSHYYTIWDGHNGLLGTGKTEVDAWVDAYLSIIRREGRCP